MLPYSIIQLANAVLKNQQICGNQFVHKQYPKQK